jgi:hypothetical protein
VLIHNLLGDPELLYAAGSAITFPLAAWWHDRPELTAQDLRCHRERIRVWSPPRKASALYPSNLISKIQAPGGTESTKIAFIGSTKSGKGIAARIGFEGSETPID